LFLIKALHKRPGKAVILMLIKMYILGHVF